MTLPKNLVAEASRFKLQNDDKLEQLDHRLINGRTILLEISS